MEWKVPTWISLADLPFPSCCFSRSCISAAALFVNVTAVISEGFYLSGFQKIEDAGYECLSLPGTRTCYDCHCPVYGLDGLLLPGVQRLRGR